MRMRKQINVILFLLLLLEACTLAILPVMYQQLSTLQVLTIIVVALGWNGLYFLVCYLEGKCHG